MIRYILLGMGILLFCHSHGQEVNSTVEREVIASSPLSNTSEAERFLLLKNGDIAELHNDKPLYAGSVRNKKLHGNWQSWYQNGALCDSGNFVHGLPNGEWKHWDIEGRLVAVRTYNADKYQRINLEMARYNSRRPAYALTVMYHRNRQSAMQYLHSSYSFPHSVRRINDLSLQQWVIENITPGNSYHPLFDQSLHHGLYMNYFQNGGVKDSGFYNNGLRQGVWVEKDNDSGRWRQGNYNNGRKTKEWKSYSAKGELQEITFYNYRGEVTGRKTFR